MHLKHLITIILVICVFYSQITIPTNANLEEGSKFHYAVVCTDFCGSKIWDGTYLDANLCIEITLSSEEYFSTFIQYNSTPIITRNYTEDYGIFNLSQTFLTQNRKEIHSGLYTWQYINDFNLTTQNISIPYFFLAHAPMEYNNNSHLMHLISGTETIRLSEPVTIKTHKYSGAWKYQYFESGSSITVVSDVVAN